MEIGRQRSFKCSFLKNNIAVEIFVVLFTLVSGLAITGENLIVFKLITVPHYVKAASNNITNSSIFDGSGNTVPIENKYVMDILDQVFRFTSLGIAGLFFIEIFLKVCTLQKTFVTKPWHIFDTVVVLATLGVEIAFQFVHFSERAVYSATYIVMLRLWRVPVLFRIRANVLQESTEQGDAELNIYRKSKTEKKCIQLEHTLSRQQETVKKVEGAQQNLKVSELSDLPRADADCNKNGDIHHIGQTSNDELGGRKDSMSDTNYVLSTSNRQRNLHENSKQNVSLHGVPDNSLMNFKDESYTEITKQSNKVTEDKFQGFKNKLMTANCVKTDSDFVDGVDKFAIKNKPLPLAVTSYNLLLSAHQRSYIPWRARKRRSSTSEIIDYSSIYSPAIDSVFVFKEEAKRYASCPSLDLENGNEINTKTVLEKSLPDSGNFKSIKKHISDVSCSKSEISQASSSENARNSKKKRMRRMSCPEYVYTQRMSITNDESILIGDHHSIEYPASYDNLGFDYDCNFRFQVLAEFDGTKTYRNEDGIPMTSL